jgi:hypothetical protein
MNMSSKHLAIATISWVRNVEEEKLLTASLAKLASYHIPVFISDGGSTASFLNFLQSIPHFNLLQFEGKGVYAQAQTSLLAAYNSGSQFIFYTEPDKESFFQSGLNKLLEEIIPDEKLGIHHASRSAKAFSSFPSFQQMTETTINNCCKEIIGNDYDYTYGPFLLNSKLVPYLHQVKEDIGWGWRPYIFTIAHRLEMTLSAFIDDFLCPSGQEKDDQKERIYRMRQLEQNIRGIVLGTSAGL